MERAETSRSWIETATHGRYLVAGGAGEQRQGLPLLVGFHGHGDNAERYLEQLVRFRGNSAQRCYRCAARSSEKSRVITSGSRIA